MIASPALNGSGRRQGAGAGRFCPPMLPREHGAWGLLLQPFTAAMILARAWDWLVLPAACLMLLGFIVREPLLVIARQRWIWREPKPETLTARICLAWELPLLALCFAVLLSYLPAGPLLAFAMLGAALTGLSIRMTLQNRQRSAALQFISTLGLGTTALLAALVLTRELPAWSWLLWGLLSLHGVASILVVHARLQAKSARRTAAGGIASRPAGSAAALNGLAFQLLAGAALAAWLNPALAAPPVLSAVLNGFEIRRLGKPESLDEPLMRVGFRTLAMSLTHMALTVAVLW